MAKVLLKSNSREAADLRRYRAHYDVIVMYIPDFISVLLLSHA